MNRKTVALALVASLVLAAISAFALLSYSNHGAKASGSMCEVSLVQRITLPNASGRIDHMDVDSAGGRLFVAMLGNNSLAEVNLTQGAFVRSLPGLAQPQGVLFVPSVNKLFVTNGGSGMVNIVDPNSLQITNSVQLSSDADNIRYDSHGTVFVGYGFGNIAALNLTAEKVISSVSLIGHPESFQLDRNDSKMFVNVPAGNYVAEVDRETNSITARWPLPTNVTSNFPMALDEAHHRLFVGARLPAEVVVYDTLSGRVVDTISVGQGPDDVFYSPNGCLYVSSRQGYTYVFSQTDPDHYQAGNNVFTGIGGGTSLFLPQLGRLYVAIPQNQTQPAEIGVYTAR
jgi:hypothetical protein